MLADLFELGRDFAIAVIAVTACWLVGAACLAWLWHRSFRRTGDTA